MFARIPQSNPPSLTKINKLLSPHINNIKSTSENPFRIILQIPQGVPAIDDYFPAGFIP
jgi:hypothetical protein